MNRVIEKNDDPGVPTEKKIEDLFALIDDIDFCMLTTRLADGALVTRPMSTTQRDDDGTIWFMTSADTHKVEEIEAEPHVSLGYFKSGEWVSVSGTARVVQDRAKIEELYEVSWKAWLPDEGGERDGGPGDPRIALLEVTPATITYFVRTTPRPLVTFQIAKAILTGAPPKIGETREVTATDLAR